MSARFPLLICLTLALAACAEAPVLTGTAAAQTNAPYPTLIPLDTLLAGRPAQPQITQASTDALNGRIANLRARAARLAGPVVDPATRAAMRGAAQRAALR